MTTIVDASVALKWFLDGDRSAEARALLDGPSVRAPRLIVLEVSHVLWKAERRGRFARDALAAADRIMSGLFAHGADTDALADRSIALMRHLDLAVFDCLYLTLAERDGGTLVTADERQFAAARRARIKARRQSNR